MDTFLNMMATLSKNSRESKLSEEMDTGMLDAKGPVVMQIGRQIREAPVPQYLPPVAPWGRYKEFQHQVKSNYKGRGLFDNPHPLATRELAVHFRNEKYVEEGDGIKRRVNRPMAAMLTWPKRFECSAFWCKGSMKLREIDGKIAPGQVALMKKSSNDEVPPSPRSLQEDATAKEEEAAPPKVEVPKVNLQEVQRVARRKSVRLRENVLEAAMAGPSPSGVDRKNRNALDAFIFQGAGKGKARADSLEGSTGETTENSSLPASTSKMLERAFGGRHVGAGGPPFEDTYSPVRPVAARGGFAAADASTVQTPRLATGGMNGIDGDTEKVMHQLHLSKVKYEKENLQAKLVVAKAEIMKVQAEEEAVQAKMMFTKTIHLRLK